MSLDHHAPEPDTRVEDVSRNHSRRIAKLEGDILVLRAEMRRLAEAVATFADIIAALNEIGGDQ